MTGIETERPEQVEAPHWTVGDRLAAFAALLPAAPAGPVVLMVADDLVPHLRTVYPTAIAAGPGGPPAPAGSAALVVVDTAVHDESVAAELVAADGVLAVIGRRGRLRIYPSLSHPELVWRRSWPVQMASGPIPWVRRSLGLGIGRADAVPRLRIVGSTTSFVDEVLADLQDATGSPGTLVGLVTGGHTVLRVRTADGDLAVRLSLTDADRVVDVASQVAQSVPAAEHLLPVVVAHGRASGRPWVATHWTPRRRRPLTWPWPARARQWQVAEELAGLLGEVVTGRTGPGWSAEWVAGAHVVPARVRERWRDRLAVLDDVPTSWCHGDLWPGNVLLDREVSTVIDWDNASERAPQGLDHLLVHAMRSAEATGGDVIEELLALVDEPAPLADRLVAGRPWAEHGRERRLPLVVAAVVLLLRNRSLHDLGREQLDRHLDQVERALDAREPDGPRTPGPDHEPGRDAQRDPEPVGDPEAGRTARGALWLATNGVVVKTSQTVVLLTLAAMLAPSALGLVALGTLVANIAAIIASLGTASALVYWRGDVHRAARTAVTIGVATGGLLAAMLWLAAPWLAAALNAEDGGAAVIRGLTVTVPFLAVAAVTNELLRRRLAFARRIIPDTVSSIVGATIAVGLAMDGRGVMALVVGQIVQATLTMLLAWVVHPPVLPGWNGEDARGLLSYGGPYAGANLLELVQLNLDYLIVSWVLGAGALGLYSLAFRLAFMPYLMIVVVTTGAAFPYLCRQRGPDLGRAAMTVMTATLTLVAPLCIGLALLADHLVILGEQWSPGVPAVAWLALYAALLSVGQLVQTTLNAAGRPTLSMLLRSCHLVLLVATLLAVARLGVTAVAVGQAAAAVVISILALGLARLNVPGFSLRRLFSSLRPAALAAAVMAGVVLLLRAVVDTESSSLIDLLVVGGVGAVAYALTVWAVDREHLREAVRLVRRSS
ncbi:MAG: oligosaccharide flippase family protein [Nocardioides sp.]